jgi:hypothetical protein
VGYRGSPSNQSRVLVSLVVSEQRFWSPGFVHVWAFMRCRCMSPLGIVRGRIGRQVSLSVGLVRSCRGQL